MEISEAARDLIVAEEVSSQSAYEHLYRHTEWPGASSGVTIGIGCDIGAGYHSTSELWAAWKGRIPDDMIRALEPAVGVTGQAAQHLAAQLKSKVDVPWAAAIALFDDVEVPKWVAIVKRFLPNCDQLSPDCLGAIVSLAYNRGPSFDNAGNRYSEMRAIKASMRAQRFDQIPDEFRSMKRLWPALEGLRLRREHEARLFERGLSTDIKAVLRNTA